MRWPTLSGRCLPVSFSGKRANGWLMMTEINWKQPLIPPSKFSPEEFPISNSSALRPSQTDRFWCLKFFSIYFEIPKDKSQITNKFQWPKFKTTASRLFVIDCPIISVHSLLRWCQPNGGNVWIIGYCNLRFICYLVLEIWNFLFNKTVSRSPLPYWNWMHIIFLI